MRNRRSVWERRQFRSSTAERAEEEEEESKASVPLLPPFSAAPLMAEASLSGLQPRHGAVSLVHGFAVQVHPGEGVVHGMVRAVKSPRYVMLRDGTPYRSRNAA
uniref:Uncharacterized protein n=1 Tax=Odontella aurita TaxID=265563 RepID=A0A7S4HKZ6_9STRA